MAIKLNVEPYCENCLEFEPTADRHCYYGACGPEIIQTNVTCKYRDRCKNIYERMKWENNNGN